MSIMKINKSQILKNAHKIASSYRVRKSFAKYAQALAFGLKRAWAEAKEAMKVAETGIKELVLDYYDSAKTWVAQITGTGGRFGFERKFLNGSIEKTSAKLGKISFDLESDKVYEVAPAYKKRYFVDGLGTEISEETVRGFFA